jgi:hypothetical protein
MLRQFPELAIIKGELFLAESPPKLAEAADIFRQVLAGARAAGVKMLALQAAIRLCKLEMVEGTVGESCRVLMEIYDSFTEGFGVPDLREARLILDEWQG